jgi:hypothetical protein
MGAAACRPPCEPMRRERSALRHAQQAPDPRLSDRHRTAHGCSTQAPRWLRCTPARSSGDQAMVGRRGAESSPRLVRQARNHPDKVRRELGHVGVAGSKPLPGPPARNEREVDDPISHLLQLVPHLSDRPAHSLQVRELNRMREPEGTFQAVNPCLPPVGILVARHRTPERHRTKIRQSHVTMPPRLCAGSPNAGRHLRPARASRVRTLNLRLPRSSSTGAVRFAPRSVRLVVSIQKRSEASPPTTH